MLGPQSRKTEQSLHGGTSFRLAVVADTHSVMHPRALEHLAALRPEAILHAGDIGELRVLDELAAPRSRQCWQSAATLTPLVQNIPR
jgi:hypothetical protein